MSGSNDPIVTSGESDYEDGMEEEMLKREEDTLYDEKADDEDEAYVGDLRTQGGKLVKPKNSDAVLSCPCCFQTVCLDCQQHERYPDQFRAMFVMNITVAWDQKLVFDGKKGGLIDLEPGKEVKVPRDDEEVYYKVRCQNCNTQVAALDMRDEVYHFYGCLASA